MAHRRKNTKPGYLKLFKFFGFIFLILALILTLAYVELGRIQTSTVDKSKIVTVHKDANMKDYTNIALFGIDSQTGSMSDRGNRSDSIIVVSINNKTKNVKMLSVYRDTYLSINGHYSKVNAAYSWGGPTLAMSTINRNLDLNITQYATVNFKILANLVDAMGGVKLDVKSEVLKNLNQYIGNMNHLNGGNSPKITTAGVQTLDGNQAVAYSRIRYTAGGDLMRASRQREVLQALFSKAKTHPVKLLTAMNKVLPQIKTNMTRNDLFSMMLSVFRYNISDQQGFPYRQKQRKYNGQDFDFPVTLKSNTIKVHKYLFDTDNYQVSDELSRINQKIINIIGY